MDTALSYGLPRENQPGTLLEGIKAVGRGQARADAESLPSGAPAYCDWAVARGAAGHPQPCRYLRSRLLAVEALLDVRAGEALPRPAARGLPAGRHPAQPAQRATRLRGALDRGVDVVGGIPHFERTMAGRRIVRMLCEFAAERGLRVDMHCDEIDDPLSRHIETLAAQTHAPRPAGPRDRLAPDVDAFDGQLLRDQADAADGEAGVTAIANPLINITLQGRHDTYPKRRGMTRVPELMAAGVAVAFGHDCVMDPWYCLGSGDMLEVAPMGLHVAQMTSRDAMRACFDAVTVNAARILGLEGYGLAPGCHADLVLLQARDPVEAIRLRAARLVVFAAARSWPRPRRGRRASLPGRPAATSFELPTF